MTYRDVLLQAAATFGTSESPFLDAVLLMAHALNVPKEKVLTRLPEPLLEVPQSFWRFCERRARGESIAHILGYKEFYGRLFVVNDDVLSPRQDTETLVEEALCQGDRIEAEGELRVLDLCTGTGVVAISIAAERPGWQLTASDLSPRALACARHNAERLLGEQESARRIRFIESDLFERIEGTFDLITANPPYVPRQEARLLREKGMTDPMLALDGGPDGMDFIRRIIAEAPRYLSNNGVLLLEMDPEQVAEAIVLLQNSGFDDIMVCKDLAGRERVAGGRYRRNEGGISLKS